MKIPKWAQRDWVVIFTIILAGIAVMCLAGQFALRLMPSWTVDADMDSAIDPNATFAASRRESAIEPVLPEIQTPISYNYLTPATQTETALTPTDTGTPRTGPTLTATPTGTGSATATLTSSPTATRTHTPTATVVWPTWTSTSRPTLSPTTAPTFTQTFTPVPPTATFTLIPPTATFTLIPPTATFTLPAPTATNTDIPVPSETPTPSNTPFIPSPTPTAPGAPDCTLVTGPGSYALSSPGYCLRYINAATYNGAVFVISNPTTSNGLSLWYGKTDPLDTACSSWQGGALNGGGTITMVASKFSGNNEIFIFIFGVSNISINSITDWNASGCP